MKKNLFSKKKFRTNLTRVLAGTLVISLCGILILWEIGIIDLPFLVRKDRRDPEVNTETNEPVTKEETYVNWDSFAKAAIDSVYNASFLENASEIVTALPFDSETMTLTKEKLSDGEYFTSLGFVVKEYNGTTTLFRAADMKEIPGGEKFEPSFYRTSLGEAVLIEKETGKYYKFDPATESFQEISFDPKKDAPEIKMLLPASYNKADGGTELLWENGLFGYKGEYKDGRRKKTFEVPISYTTAFPYSEGYAVMADETGKITVRDYRGEEVFTDLFLVLPDKEGVERLGFFAFDGGILRVTIAQFDEEGKLVTKKETIINPRGQEVSLPKGYSALSLCEGILVVTDGEKYGYLTASGAWIGTPDFTKASPFMEGLAVVADENGKKGLINNKGDIVLPCAFDYISNFSEGYALCYSKGTGWHLLSKVNGKFGSEENTPPDISSFHTKVTITRGPQNTFDYDPDEIIEFPPILSTPSRTTHPENETPAKKTE